MKRAVLWFLAGFLATIAFHQPALGILHAAGIASRGPYATAAVPPFGVPAFLSLAFWGGVWGIVMMFVLAKRRDASFWVVALVFGAIFPTLVAWFIVAPLKHQPIAGGWKPAGIATGLIVNGAWGIGTAFFAWLFRRMGAKA